jgi:hypothetical protein
MSERIVVAPGGRAKVALAFSQPGVTYQLCDRDTGRPILDAGAAITLVGTGGPITLVSPPIDVDTSYRVLAVKREDALPGRAAVERRGVRLLSKQKRVERIDVELGDATYQLISDGRKVTGMRGQAVRGVTIKREELGLDAWVERLTRELDELAQSSTEARAALDRLLGA